jgi:hypothetical protein
MRKTPYLAKSPTDGAKKLGPGGQHRFEAMEEIEHTRHFQTIIDLLAALVVLDDPGILEDGQVLGDRGHVMSDEFAQIADTPFPARQFVNDQKPRAMGQGFHDVRSGGKIVSSGLREWLHEIFRRVLVKQSSLAIWPNDRAVKGIIFDLGLALVEPLEKSGAGCVRKRRT